MFRSVVGASTPLCGAFGDGEGMDDVCCVDSRGSMWDEAEPVALDAKNACMRFCKRSRFPIVWKGRSLDGSL